jgi:multiple sugar transport system substrate-binding protein
VKKMKKVVVLSVAAATVFSLVGCGSKSGSVSSPAASAGAATSATNSAVPAKQKFEGVNLRVVTANHPWTEALKPMIPEFEKATGIKVNMEQFFEDQLTQKLTVELTSGSQSLDVFMIRPLQDSKLYMKNGWVADLTGKTNDAEWDYKDFSEGSVSSLMQDGKLYGVPLITEREILYYRKDILEKNNIQVPKTLDELKAAAQKLNDPKNEFYGFVARGQRSPAVTQFSSFLYSSGGDFLNMKDGKATIDTPEAIQAFKIYGELLKNYGPPGVLNMSWPQAMGVFAQGKAAMYTDADSIYPNMLDPEKSKVPADQIGFAVFPAGAKGQKPTNVTAWGLSVNSKSKQQDAAWEFIKWATNKENSTKIQGAGNPGARKSVWLKPEGTKAFPKQLAEVMDKSSQIGVGYDRPLVIGVGAARDMVGTVIVTAISGGDVEKTAKEENAKFQELIDKERK